MSTSSLTAGMLAGLTGDTPPPSKGESSSKSSTSSSGTGSTTSAAAGDVSAELRFASVNWERKKRAPNANPRRSVDMPLTVEDRFLAVPWDPAEEPVAPVKASAPEITEDDERAAEEREKQLSVSSFFKKANW